MHNYSKLGGRPVTYVDVQIPQIAPKEPSVRGKREIDAFLQVRS